MKKLIIHLLLLTSLLSGRVQLPVEAYDPVTGETGEVISTAPSSPINTDIASALSTNIIADVRDILEIDPGDNTKFKVKAAYTIRTVNAAVPSAIVVTKLDVPITAGIAHTIPSGFTFWIGVKDNAGTPQYDFKFTLDEFDLTEFAILGRAFTDETVPNQLNSVVGTFWWEGWNYGKTLYDLATSRELSYTISGGDITPDAALTYTREEGTFWRFMSYNSLKDPNKGVDPQTAVTAYFTYSSAGGFEQTSTFEVGFIDDGAGGKTAVLANKWSIYKVFHFASSNFESAQRGKQAYDSLHDARARKGEEDLALNADNTNAAFTHIAYVKSGATDLTDTEEVVFERIDLGSLSSGGDPLVSSLAQSGLIDWVGNDILTINGGDNTKFDVGEFRVGSVDRSTGLIRFVRTFNGLTAVSVSAITANVVTYVGYSHGSDAIITQSTPFSRADFSNTTPLGKLWHRNKTILDQAQTLPLTTETSADYAGQLAAFGALRQDATAVTANGANQKIDIASFVLETIGGTSTDRNLINIATPGAATALSFTPVHRAVTTGKVVIDTITSDIDFTVFDDGSGTLATLSTNNKFGIHYICIFPFRTTIDFFLIRGDQEYDTLAGAQEGLLQNPIISFPDFEGEVCVSAVIGKKTVTDLAAAITAGEASLHASDRFGSFGSGGAGGGGGSGDVVGPVGPVIDNSIVRNDGTTGKLVQDSGWSISDGGALTAHLTTASVFETMNYIDNGTVLRQFVVLGNDIVKFNNRAANGTLEFYANTSTSGAPGEVLTATFSDTDVTIATLLDVQGNITLTGTVDGIDIATDVAANTTHRTSTGADHTFINQNVSTTGFPTFAQVTVDNLRLDLNSLTSLNANGDIFLTPNGTGRVKITTQILDLGKSTDGLVAELGNATLRNRATNDFILQNDAFTLDAVGIGQNVGGKITLGAPSNTIDFLTGTNATFLAGQFLDNGGLFLGNRTTTPATPVGGGVLYVEGGALKYINPSGNTTTLVTNP